MKTLEDMKEEYARENNFYEWSYILYSIDDPAEIDEHFDKVASLYAIEVAKETLRLASENARIEERDVDYKNIKLVDFGRYSFRGDESPVEVSINKQSILSESNIPLDVIK